jgi:recombinational DNA repair protein (RecF pathway)
MGRFQGIKVEVVIEEHAAARRRNANYLLAYSHFVDNFCEETIDNSMAATGTVVEMVLLERLGSGVNFLHCFLVLTDW